MTISMIVKWVEAQQSLKLKEASDRYCEEMAKEAKRFNESIGLDEIVDKIYPLLYQADNLHESWLHELSERKNIEVHAGRWNTFEMKMYQLSTRERLAESIRAEVSNLSLELRAIENAFATERDNIASNYRTVICHVRRLRKPKKALEYLRSLGFDVSELEAQDEVETTAIAVPVDTSYLFVTKAEEAGDSNV